ncbi:MAG: IPExxxVDY family protein [Flavobacteriaceae bacterium]
MRQKKIVLTTEFEDYNDYDLFAIHSPLEDFFLAFQLNKTLGTRFINVTERIKPRTKIPFFSRFINEISTADIQWELIANHFTSVSKTSEENQLFDSLIDEQINLIPSLSKVDYFLKVPKENLTSAQIAQLQNLNEIQMIYPITETKIKENPNLIFD